MNIINTELHTWALAKKTQNILAKPMSSVFADLSAVTMFLINTLEGKEVPAADAMLCLGIAVGEPWQQTSKALLRKYDVVGVTPSGWLDCKPKPENEVEFFIATEDGFIEGLWGDTVEGIDNMQRVRAGDTIARQTYDHKDQWVVNRALWNGTYSAL